MKYLLDTHVLIWFLFEPEKLSEKVKQILKSGESQIDLSAASFWEISIKFKFGKLSLGRKSPFEIYNIFLENGYSIIPLKGNETSTFYNLEPEYHRDPFDRILIWQALKNDYCLITDDSNIKLYQSSGLKVVW